MYLQLSHKYHVWNEANCSYLICLNEFSVGSLDSPVLLLPPFIGYIITNIGKYKYEIALRKIAASLQVSQDAVEIFLNNLRSGENKEMIISDQESITFPKNLFIEKEEPDSRIFHTCEKFDPSADFVPHRPSIPFNLNLMVTTACTTNCIYCYANRNLGENLTAPQLATFISDAKTLGVINIALTGGDIFAMQDWTTVLSSLIQNGYKSFLSTKTPISKNELLTLKQLGFKKFQFSLDSTDPNVLSELLNVDHSYLDKVKLLLSNCDNIGIAIQIRTVVTKINSDLADIKKLYSLLCKHACVCEWDITPAFFSEFKTEYKSYGVTNSALITLYEFVQQNKPTTTFPINLNKIADDGYKLQRYSDCDDFINHNQLCTANTYGLSVLASGDCTVCEMLYKNPEYLLGNIKETSLIDIWNSQRALELYHPEPFEDETTPCSTCIVFDKCKQSLEKRVCYVDIAKVNGKNSFKKPDPRCPKADPVEFLL